MHTHLIGMGQDTGSMSARDSFREEVKFLAFSCLYAPLAFGMMAHLKGPSPHRFKHAITIINEVSPNRL
jgi:hypothetical protein